MWPSHDQLSAFPYHTHSQLSITKGLSWVGVTEKIGLPLGLPLYSAPVREIHHLPWRRGRMWAFVILSSLKLRLDCWWEWGNLGYCLLHPVPLICYTYTPGLTGWKFWSSKLPHTSLLMTQSSYQNRGKRRRPEAIIPPNHLFVSLEVFFFLKMRQSVRTKRPKAPERQKQPIFLKK